MTQFSDIYDLALVSIDDYRLEYLAESDEEAFYTYLEGLLVASIPKFVCCRQPLTFDLTTSSFNSDLTLMEKSILADLMVIRWLEKITNDIKSVNLKLQGRNQKINSEATNLKEKSERLDRMREQVRQSMNDYQLSYR